MVTEALSSVTSTEPVDTLASASPQDNTVVHIHYCDHRNAQRHESFVDIIPDAVITGSQTLWLVECF